MSFCYRSLIWCIVLNETCWNSLFTSNTYWCNVFINQYIVNVWDLVTAWKFHIDDLTINCTINGCEQWQKKSTKTSPLDYNLTAVRYCIWGMEVTTILRRHDCYFNTTKVHHNHYLLLWTPRRFFCVRALLRDDQKSRKLSYIV